MKPVFADTFTNRLREKKSAASNSVAFESAMWFG